MRLRLSLFLCITLAIIPSMELTAQNAKTDHHADELPLAPQISCAELAPKSIPACDQTSPHAVSEIWETLYWGKEIESALKEVEKLSLRELTLEERIVTQSALFFLFYRESYNHTVNYMSPKELDHFRATKVRISKQVARLALPADTLKKLGTEADATITAWLADPSSWHDRVTRQEPLMHESFFGMAFTFRPVKTKKFRAIFSQCVAIDDQWLPHVTPVVAGIEAIHGKTLQEKACVAHLDASRLRCPPATRLQIEDFAKGTPNGVAQFLGDFGRADQRCIACHHGHRNLFVGDAKTTMELQEHLQKRRATFLERSENMASYLKDWSQAKIHN